jgi:hypothetical protein
MRAEKMRTFLSPDSKTGYAVHPESGDIRNVFNHGANAVADALANKGGKVLDAFDTGLGNFYRDFGFNETWRSPWNNEYRPAGWDEAKHGLPDVIGMEHPRAGTASADDLLASYDAARAARKTPPSVPKTQTPNLPTYQAEPAAAAASPFPPQTDLPRHVGPRIPQSRIDDVEQEATNAFASPQFLDWLKNGKFADWYDTRGTQSKAVDALGDQDGPEAFRDLMNKMGATTARSSPPNNLRRASYYRAFDMAGLLYPDALRTGEYKAVPAGRRRSTRSWSTWARS